MEFIMAPDHFLYKREAQILEELRLAEHLEETARFNGQKYLANAISEGMRVMLAALSLTQTTIKEIQKESGEI